MAEAPLVLATDLDGTLIPLEGQQENQADLLKLTEALQRHGRTLGFVTGRHLQSVLDVTERYALPAPAWLICDVGTSIYSRQDDGSFVAVEAYQTHQQAIIASMAVSSLRQHLGRIDALVLQEPERQGRFKLSYYVDIEQLAVATEAIRSRIEETQAPYAIVSSIDPFEARGLIDLLPATVSKDHALRWWARHTGVSPERMVFAGDSGNDLAALTAGYRAIVVGNAHRDLARQVHDAHRSAGWHDRLYLARAGGPSGVLEGCQWFGLVDLQAPPTSACGATPVSATHTDFRVWAPRRKSVQVAVEDGVRNRTWPLAPEKNGFFQARIEAPVGSRYRYKLDGEVQRPDPASRYQPDGVHGVSQIVDPNDFAWTDSDWRGHNRRDLIFYEIHIGTFTKEGTFRAATKHLSELADLGVTAVEVMPVAQAPGEWSWGYEGVDLFAVRNTYGGPEEFKYFVDACHAAGLSVVLDVVYNHVGPEGNYLGDFGPYRSRRHKTPWGDAFNFDGRQSRAVRQLILDNAVAWLREYHLDGLRLDAIEFMADESELHILDELRRVVSSYATCVDRSIHLIAEANVYDETLISPQENRDAYDAIWCDCLMYSIYSVGCPQLQPVSRIYKGAADLAGVLRRGYVYERHATDAQVVRDGSDESHQGGAAMVQSLVIALQTHDGVGNHPRGLRIHQVTSRDFQRAAAALVLLYPAIPLVFMGEEWSADAPFPFFCQFEDERLRRAVDRGRARQFPPQVRKAIPGASALETFQSSQWRNAHRDAGMFDWYRRILRLRKQGQQEGWLSFDSMRVEHHLERQTFSLRFTDQDGGRIAVHARLNPPHESSVPAVPIALEGKILLSSGPAVDAVDGMVQLRPNDAVISRTSPT